MEIDVTLIQDVVILTVSLIAFIFTLVRTGSIQKSVNTLKEFEEMKYRLPDYRESEKEKRGTVFTLEVPEYRLDKKSNTLVELPEKKNLQDVLNSNRDVELTTSIERLMPDSVESDNGVMEAYGYNADRLEMLVEYSEALNELKRKYAYDDEITIAEIVKDLTARNKKILQSMQKQQTKQEVVSNESKENVEAQ